MIIGVIVDRVCEKINKKWLKNFLMVVMDGENKRKGVWRGRKGDKRKKNEGRNEVN